MQACLEGIQHRKWTVFDVHIQLVWYKHLGNHGQKRTTLFFAHLECSQNVQYTMSVRR